MKPRTTLLLAVVLVLLAGAATLMESNRKRARSAEGPPVFAQFSAEKANRIEIESPGKKVALAKPGDRWIVETENGRRADAERIQSILDALGKIQSKEVISRQADKHPTFEVTDSAVLLTVRDGDKELASIFVGKPGPDFMSTYIRPKGEDTVYLAQVYLPSVVDPSIETWRSYLLIPAGDVVAVTTKNSKETVSVERSANGAWTMKSPVEGPVRADVLQVVLDQLKRLKATAFADSAVGRLAEFGLEPDTSSVEVRMADGATHKLIVGATNAANQSFTKLAGDEEVYLVAIGRWRTIFRPSETLMPPKTEASTTQTTPPTPQTPQTP